MKMALKRTAIATSTVACVALLSFSWSEQRGVSLGVESAQARINRPSTPLSVAGVARRQYRRSAYGYGLFAAAVAATTSPWNYDDYYCYGDPYAGRGDPPAAITIATTLAATASVAATSPDSTHGRRCFRATTAAGAGEAILAAVDSILEYAGARAYLAGTNTSITTPRPE